MKKQLATLGFKLSHEKYHERYFMRDYVDAIQELAFGHSTHHEHFVKYYSFNPGISYKEVDKIMKDMGTIIVNGTGCNIATFCPFQTPYMEWRVADNDSDEHVTTVIQEIVHLVKDYAIPVLDRYSDIGNVLYDYENKTVHRGFFFHNQCITLLYYIAGNLNKAIAFLEETIERRRFYELHGSLPIEEQGKEYIPMSPIYAYIDFEKRFKAYVGLL